MEFPGQSVRSLMHNWIQSNVDVGRLVRRVDISEGKSTHMRHTRIHADKQTRAHGHMQGLMQRRLRKTSELETPLTLCNTVWKPHSSDVRLFGIRFFNMHICGRLIQRKPLRQSVPISMGSHCMFFLLKLQNTKHSKMLCKQLHVVFHLVSLGLMPNLFGRELSTGYRNGCMPVSTICTMRSALLFAPVTVLRHVDSVNNRLGHTQMEESLCALYSFMSTANNILDVDLESTVDAMRHDSLYRMMACIRDVQIHNAITGKWQQEPAAPSSLAPMTFCLCLMCRRGNVRTPGWYICTLAAFGISFGGKFGQAIGRWTSAMAFTP